MAARTRTLAAFAAGALLVPLNPFASPALADHIDERTIDNACPENGVSENNYSDVPDANIFERQINCVTDYGIATGTDATKYTPEGNVSRRQMAQFIYREARLGGVTFDITSDPGYSDDNNVTGEARDAIWGLSNAGVLKGVGGGRFAPSDNVTRAQMATFLVGLADLLGLEGFETTEDFFDDDDATTHEANINRIASEGVTIGQGGDRVYGFLNPVLRQQMAAFLARILDIAVVQGAIEPEYDITPVTVTINEAGETIDAGDPVTGEITGSNVRSATVSGACVTAGSVQDIDAAADGIQFSIPTDEGADTGDCDITFTVTFTSGRSQDFTATLTLAGTGAGTNDRPELVAVEVVSTTTPGQVTPGNPAGTVIRYSFDEDVLETGAPPTAGLFLLYEADGTQLVANTVLDVDGNDVTVRFNAVDTADEVARLTLATVDIDAVRDLEGNSNPEGDAPLGQTTGGGTMPLPAGVTDAPDLVSFGNFRQGRAVGETAVDVTFDQAAFVSNPNGFSLVLLAGASGVDDDNEVDCVGPAPGTDATGPGSVPSGGTIAGGNGTTTLTVICQAPNDQILTAADVARGTIGPNAVSDVQQDADPATPVTGDSNPLQAADLSNGGNTAEPDLVSVELRPSVDGSNGGVDSALFTFDQEVDSAVAASFFLYTVTGDERGGTNARVNRAGDARQVLVDFAGGTVNVVGGNVRGGAVTVAVSPTNVAADVNEQDEVGVPGTSDSTGGQTSGRTSRPDLVSVAITQAPADEFGNPGRFRATYTFDEDVVLRAADAFRLFLEDGTRLNGATCAIGGTEETDNTVTCTGFTNGTRAATSEEIGSAVLGTVDGGAVNNQPAGGAGTETNPEGAEPTA